MNAFQTNYDVVVVGLGTAGSIAAITAAKSGLRVLGIERLSSMGGTATLGLIGGYYFGSKGGLFEQINEQASDIQKQLYVDVPYMGYHAKAAVLAQQALQSGAQLRFEARVTDVYLEGKKVVGLRYFHQGKQHSVGAKIVIDCTGEAELCRMAGCETRFGRAFDGQTQPFSNLALACFGGRPYGMNKDSGYVNQTDDGDLSLHVIRSTANLFDVMQANKEGTFITNAALLGVREGHTIVGEETLTLADVLQGKQTAKPLFYAYSNVDNHGKDTAFEDEIVKDWLVAAGLFGVNLSVGVPTGALIPKGYDGILVAGRCLAVEHNMASLLRMKSDMEKCGEAAAMLAFVCIQSGQPTKDVDYQTLAKLLAATGCLDEANNVGQYNRIGQQTLEPFEWMTQPDDIVNALETDRPGIAIWSATRMGEAMLPSLKTCLDSPNPMLRHNAAIALGLMGQACAAPVLREMVATRDGFVPKTCVKYTYTHGASAIYLLGRLRDADSIPVLLEVMQSEGAFDNSNFVPDEFYLSENDVRFQHMAQALVSLSMIVTARPEHKQRVVEALQQILLRDDFSIAVSLKDNPHAKHDMTALLLRYYRFAFQNEQNKPLV